MQAYQISLIVGFILGMIELATGAFIFLGMAIGMVSVAFVQWLFSDFSMNRDMMVFAVISTLSFVVLRMFFAKAKDQEKSELDINQY